MWKAEIEVMLKKSVLDPQGQAVENALMSLGYDNVKNVRIGKYLEVTVSGGDSAAAEAQVREMCERLLANTVIEDYTFTISPAE
jgi:phosphoribosylformylglycinamidine synthase subunit PurS